MDERSERISTWFEAPVLVAALLVLPTIVIQQSALGPPWRVVVQVLNWLIWAVFAAEVVILLLVVSDRRAWLRSHLLDVAIVLFTPPFLPASLQAARALRLLRILRLLRLAPAARRLLSLQGLQYAAVLAVVVALGGGAAFSATEPHVSTWDGVWWSITTMTTVAYGDIYPHTSTGRLLSIVLMLVGIGFIALLTGAIAERFLSGDIEEAAEEEQERVGAIAVTEEQLLAEIRAITGQLRQLETAVERLAERRR